MISKKIDERLLGIVQTANVGDDIDCLVYAQNYAYTKFFLTQKLRCNVTEYPFIKAFGIKTNLTKIKKIANVSQVRYVSSITQVFAQMDISRKVMDVDEAQKWFDGTGVTVAVIDTGIAENLDFCSFQNRILHFQDFVAGKTIPYDDNGHGTFVCGALAGNGFLSGTKFRGVAPNCQLVVCKTLDKNGECDSLKILQAMQWIYDNRKKYDIKVVCMSFGSNPLQSGDPLMLGAEALWDAGIVVVCAGGNSGPATRTIKSPGVSAKVITVGALDDGRRSGTVEQSRFCVANFSSRGPAFQFFKPDCIACGVDVTSVSNSTQSFYSTMSGTSVATPIVAGACTLLLQKEPNLSPFAVKKKVISACKKISGNRNSEGFGFVDVAKLLF